MVRYFQKEIKIPTKSRGFHIITDVLVEAMPELSAVKVGFLQVFIKHSSASLTVNENADPTVREDFENFFSRLVAENEPYYRHTLEGGDDLPAHIKASLLGSNIQLPVTNGMLNLGVWQGVYLCEHRNHGGARTLVLTLHGEVE